MERSLILETSFVIDLEREQRKRHPGSALAFLEQHPGFRLLLTFTVAGELASGGSMADRTVWRSFVSRFLVLESSSEVCWFYGEIYRFLQTNRLLIGANDLWIAATGLAYAVPVVTRNGKHFRRVPGLEVLGY